MEISDEAMTPEVEDKADKKVAWDMLQRRSNGFRYRNRQLIDDKLMNLKGASEKRVFEKALADN